jgi:poly(A) RNA polymerase GLD2
LVLELRINETIVDVDISIQNHKTVLNSYIIRQYTRIDRRFPVLACIIRKWAKTNQLFGGNCGRFNSYALNLMVIHYLQSGVSPPILPYLGETHPSLFEFDATVKTINVKQDLDVHFGKFPLKRHPL